MSESSVVSASTDKPSRTAAPLQPVEHVDADAGRAHPHVMGWLGATALGMGGSNQSLFLLAALGGIAGHGGHSSVGVRTAAELGGAAGVDRAGADVAEPCRRDLGVVRRGLSSVQPGAGQPHRDVLLVGMGPDVRPDGDPVGVGAPPVVPAVHSGHRDGGRAGDHLRSTQPVRDASSHQGGHLDRRRLRCAGICLGDHPGRHRQCRLGSRRRRST